MAENGRQENGDDDEGRSGGRHRVTLKQRSPDDDREARCGGGGGPPEVAGDHKGEQRHQQWHPGRRRVVEGQVRGEDRDERARDIGPTE
jgi:hypothetical protein